MRTVSRIGLPHLLGERPASFPSIPDGLLGHIGLHMIVHLEGRMKARVDAVVQRPLVVEAVIEGRRHLLVHRQRHTEDGQNLQLRVLGIALVHVFQVGLAVPAGAAAERANLQVFECVVPDERTKRPADDFR